MTTRLKPLVLVVLLCALIAAALLFPLGEWAVLGAAWIDSHPRVAWIAFIAAYVAAAVLVVPGSILTLAAGFLFGLPVGVALVSAGSVLGAAAAFLVGRFLARDWVARRIAGMPRFRALDSATRHEGFVIVLLARLSPLFPFNLLNYGLGLTAVRFRDYVLASWAGMLPATVVYVYIGTLAKDLTQITTGRIEGGPAGTALLVAGFVATIVLTVLVTRKANRTLAAHLEREAGDA
ncbi:MAG TPA: TVP38/TMEM64 family protein [Gammaproteobacteria bacterium]